MTDYENPRKNQRSWRTNGEIDAISRGWVDEFEKGNALMEKTEKSLRGELDSMTERVAVANYGIGLLQGWILGVVMSAVLFWLTKG